MKLQENSDVILLTSEIYTEMLISRNVDTSDVTRSAGLKKNSLLLYNLKRVTKNIRSLSLVLCPLRYWCNKFEVLLIPLLLQPALTDLTNCW